MNSLKELIDKIYLNIQKTDLLKKYPEYTDKKMVGFELEWIALDIIPDFIPEDKKEEFIDSCEENYNESTFKKYISNYSDFLNTVESEFYKELE